jgi:hypothetical protein
MAVTDRRIHSGDRVLPTVGDPGGAVGPNDHCRGAPQPPQRDQIDLSVLVVVRARAWGPSPG